MVVVGVSLLGPLSLLDYIAPGLINATESLLLYLIGRKIAVPVPKVGLKQTAVILLPRLWLLPYHEATHVSDLHSSQSALRL